MNKEGFTNLLTSLSVIAQLKPNHYLYTRGQSIGVGARTHYTFLTRWWLVEDRHENMDRVERLVHTALHELERLHRSMATDNAPVPYPDSGFDETQRRNTIITCKALLYDALVRVRHGLAMLRTTYRGDGQIEARVDVLNSFIDASLRMMNSNRQVPPVNPIPEGND